MFILGYRKNEFGWLIGYVQEGVARPLAVMELGVSRNIRREMFPILRGEAVSENREFVFVEPIMKCNVKFRNWTRSGAMRLPIFQGFIN